MRMGYVTALSLLLIPAFGLINWLKGWGPIDPPHHNNPPKWRIIAAWASSTWACAAYLALSMLPFCQWWQALIGGLVYGGWKFTHNKRRLFDCWKLPELKDRLKATAYGCSRGLILSLAIAPVYSLSWQFGLALLLPGLYGLIYFAMNVLPNPPEQGETVGRAIYGLVFGVAMYLAISASID